MMVPTGITRRLRMCYTVPANQTVLQHSNNWRYFLVSRYPVLDYAWGMFHCNMKNIPRKQRNKLSQVVHFLGEQTCIIKCVMRLVTYRFQTQVSDYFTYFLYFLTKNIDIYTDNVDTPHWYFFLISFTNDLDKESRPNRKYISSQEILLWLACKTKAWKDSSRSHSK